MIKGEVWIDHNNAVYRLDRVSKTKFFFTLYHQEGEKSKGQYDTSFFGYFRQFVGKVSKTTPIEFFVNRYQSLDK